METQTLSPIWHGTCCGARPYALSMAAWVLLIPTFVSLSLSATSIYTYSQVRQVRTLIHTITVYVKKERQKMSNDQHFTGKKPKNDVKIDIGCYTFTIIMVLYKLSSYCTSYLNFVQIGSSMISPKYLYSKQNNIKIWYYFQQVLKVTFCK